jgi:alcohol dehydrogenase (NADP+)
MVIDGYIQVLRNGGAMVQLGAPSGPCEVNLFPLIMGQKRIVGSIIGNQHEIREMLNLAAEKQIKPWVQTRPMSEANQAMLDMAANKARYRLVLTN